jgi:hypothetical protein
VSGRIQRAAIAYIDGRGWPYTVEDDHARVSFPGFGTNGAWTVYAVAREADEQLLVHSVFEEPVPPRRREEMALFLTRANFGLVIGNFELDLDSGELRYKTSIDVEGAELTEPLIDHVVLANVATFDRYLPGIEAVLEGTDALLAVSEVERP